jgi:hypothetical protein
MGITWKKVDLPTLRAKQLSTINAMCQQTIYNGIDVELSSGVQHFSLEAHDQTNIDSMFTAVTMGASEYPYHCDGGQCVMYSAADIAALYVAYKIFVTRQTTYCNISKAWMERENDNAVIGSYTYGCALPDDLQKQMDEIMTAAEQQIKVLLSQMQV